MDTDSLQGIMLAIVQSQGAKGILQKIVQCLAEDPAVVLTRIWVIAPGDICASCPMLEVCPDHQRCLHLVASAGNVLLDRGAQGGPGEAWSRLDGRFQRIPLNARFDFRHLTTNSEMIYQRIQGEGGKNLELLDSDWGKAQKVRSFVGLPLVFEGVVLGLLAVFSRKVLHERELDRLRILSALAALAITHTSPGSFPALDWSAAGMVERWRAVFDKSTIGLALTDRHGCFLDVNRAYEKAIGYTKKELRKLSFFDITPEEFRESNRQLAIDLWANRIDQYQFEKPYRRKDGSLVWVRLHATLVPGADGDPRFAMALCEDISERKRAEESLRESEERWRTLLEINNAIVTKLNPSHLFHAIGEAVKRVVPFGRLVLILPDSSTGALRLTAVEGPHPGEHFAVGYEVERESVSRWVFDHRRPILRQDLEKEAHYPSERLLLSEGIRSLVGLPLIFREEARGVFFVASMNKGEYSDSDVSFLQEVANQIALAVGNMRAYEEIGILNKQVARTADHLRTLLDINNAIITNLSQEALLRSIAEALRRVVPFDRAALTIYQPAGDVFRFVAIEGGSVSSYFQPGLEGNPREHSVGWVFQHQQPILRRDLEKEQKYLNEQHLAAEGMRSHCVVPLIVRGKSIGTLNVAHHTPGQYLAEDAEYLQEVANQVALAVENMQSYEEIAALKARLEKENIYLQEEIRTEQNFDEIVGNSRTLQQVLRSIEQVAPTDSTVLIHGETGTGKELIARAIHNRSARRDRPLVRVDCSAIPAGLVESELFGHMKGAFTGASERRTGRFEIADGGTIFLDEIGELPLEMQAKLLRVLQEREFEPVGSSRPVRVDVRVIAATNRNLLEAVNSGRFRSDLFYRLNVFPLEVPPLRDRRSDIPQLVNFYLTRYSKKLGKRVHAVLLETMERLISYPWPGNVRELQNVIERAVILSPGSTLSLDRDVLPGPSSGAREKAEMPVPGPSPVTFEPVPLSTMEELERTHILAALQQTGGVIEGPRGAAKILNLHPNTLRHRMQKLGIKRPGHRQR